MSDEATPQLDESPAKPLAARRKRQEDRLARLETWIERQVGKPRCAAWAKPLIDEIRGEL